MPSPDARLASSPLFDDRRASEIAQSLRLRAPEDIYGNLPPRLREEAARALETFHHLSPLPLLPLGQRSRDFRTTGSGSLLQSPVVAASRRLIESAQEPHPHRTEWPRAWIELARAFQETAARWSGLASTSLPDDDVGVVAARLALRFAALAPGRPVALAATMEPALLSCLRGWITTFGVRCVIVGNAKKLTEEDLRLSAIADAPFSAFFVCTPNALGVRGEEIIGRAVLSEGTPLVAVVSDPFSLIPTDATRATLAQRGVDAAIVECAPLGSNGESAAFVALSEGFLSLETEFRRVLPSGIPSSSDASPPLPVVFQGALAFRLLGEEGCARESQRTHEHWERLVAALARRGIGLRDPDAERFREGVFIVPDAERRVERALRRGYRIDAILEADGSGGTADVRLRCPTGADEATVEELALLLSGASAEVPTTSAARPAQPLNDASALYRFRVYVEELAELSLPTHADRRWRASTPQEAIESSLPGLEDAHAAGLLAQRLDAWTGFSEWNFSFATSMSARTAAFATIRQFHAEHGFPRHLVLVDGAVGPLLDGLQTAASLAGFGVEPFSEEALEQHGRNVAAVWLAARGRKPDEFERLAIEARRVGALAFGNAIDLRKYLGRVRIADLGLHAALLPLPAFLFASGSALVALGGSVELAPFLPGPRARHSGGSWLFTTPAAGISPATFAPTRARAVRTALAVHESFGPDELRRRALRERLLSEERPL